MEVEKTGEHADTSQTVTRRDAALMYRLPLGMWGMLLSTTPRGEMHVFLVHEAAVGME